MNAKNAFIHAIIVFFKLNNVWDFKFVHNCTNKRNGENFTIKIQYKEA